MPNLKAIIYSIRNLYDTEVLRGKSVNASLFNKFGSKTESEVWKLDREEDFYRLHKVLLTFNSCKSKFEFNRKNELRTKKMQIAAK